MAGMDLVFRFLGVDAGAGREFEKMGAYAEGTSRTLKSVALGVGAVGAVIGVESIKMAANFQTATTRIHTQANASNAEVAKLSKGFLSMAGAVATTPAALADAGYHIASIGQHSLTAAQQLRVLRIAAEGAKIGGADLTDVTNTLDAALVAHIKGVKNYSQTMGVLNSTVGAGDMSMQNLADAFGPLGSTFKGFGVTIQQAGAALATFGDNNIRGALAGSQLRQSITALADPLKFGQDQLAAWGLKSGNLAKQLEHGGLTEALNVLKQKMTENGVTASKMGPLLAEMFGKRGPQQGLSILLNELDRYHSKLGEVQQGATGFASAWKGYTKTFGYSFDSLRSSVESLLIQVGTKLLPYVTEFTNWLATKAVPALERFGHWLVQNSEWTKPLALALAGLAAALAGPMVWIPALIAGLVALYNKSASFRGIVDDIGTALKPLGQFIVTEVVPAFQRFGQWVQRNQAWLKPLAATLVLVGVALSSPITMTLALVAALTALYKRSATFRAAMQAVGTVVKTIFTAMLHVGESVFHGIGALIHAFASGPLAYVRARFADFSAFWKSHSQQIKEITRAAWAVISTVVKVAAALLVATVRPAMTVLAAIFRTAWDIVKNVVSTAWNVIAAVVRTGIRLVLDTIGVVLDLITGKWGKAWNDAKQWVSDAIHGIGNILSAFANGAINLLYDAGRDLVLGLVNGIKSMASAAVGAAKSVVGDAVSGAKSLLGIHSPSRVFHEIGHNMMLGLANGIKGTSQTALDEVKSAITKLVTLSTTDLARFGQTARTGTVSAAQSAFTTLISQVRSAGGSNELVSALTDTNKQLDSAIKIRIAALTKLNNAEKQLATDQKARAGEVANVRSAFTGSFDVTSAGADDDGNVSAGSVLAQAKQAANRARLFVKDMKLLAGHLNKAAFRQLAEAGPSALPQAQALLQLLRSGNLGAFNSAEGALGAAGTTLGNLEGNRLYGGRLANDRSVVRRGRERLHLDDRSVDRLATVITHAIRENALHEKTILEIDGKKIATAIRTADNKNARRK